MRRFLSLSLALAFLLCLSIAITGCDSDSDSGSVSVIRLMFDGKVIPNNTLSVSFSDGPLTFTADVQATGKASKDFTLESSDTAVATVSDKTVTLAAGGSTRITATAKGDSAKKHTITLNVWDDRDFGITVNGGSADKTTAKPGQTVTLTAGTEQGRVFSDWTIIPPPVAMISPTQFRMPADHVTVTGNFTEPSAGTIPYNITNNFAEDSSSGFLAQWHNASNVTTQALQIVNASGSFEDARPITVTGERFEAYGTVGTFAERNIFRTEVKGLSPATLYKYRMGGAGAWTKTYYHLTSGGSAADFSFTVATDPQASTLAAFESMITALRRAEAYDADNRFFVFCGDMVEDIFQENEVVSYTSAASQFNIHKPIAAIQGNHDTYNTSSSHVFGEATVFNAFFTFPDNGWNQGVHSGPDRSSSYYFYYNNVLVIMLNTLATAGPTTPGSSGDPDYELQAAWLEDVLKNDRDKKLSKYTVVAMHFGVFGNYYYESYYMRLMRTAYGKIFTDYGVDIVFSGHDHTYARSNPIKIEENTLIDKIEFSSTDGGTIFSIAGTTGPKYYSSAGGEFLEACFPKRTVSAGDIQPGMFVNIKVSADRLTVTAMRSDGKQLDDYVVFAKR